MPLYVGRLEELVMAAPKVGPDNSFGSSCGIYCHGERREKSYAYKNTSYEPGCTEPLRKLVTTFAALNFANFRGSEVDELIMSKEVTDREFVLGVMLKAMQRWIISRQNLRRRLQALPTIGKTRKSGSCLRGECRQRNENAVDLSD